MTEAQKTARAMQRVRALTGLYIHAVVFAVVMTVLFAFNLTDPEWWVHWPLFGWGVGLAAHAWAVYGRGAEMLQRWQLRKVYELKNQM
ncbi:MAG: 2TM domain-containing protein [Hyphomicrobiaceae bacterium]|nr:2TM domain-containing protein [Hyphomicrobiaceae bacterium]